MSDRKYIVEGMSVNQTYGNSTIDVEKARPAWTRLKTEMGRASARRFIQRCENIFANTVEKCNGKFRDAQVSFFSKLYCCTIIYIYF